MSSIARCARSLCRTVQPPQRHRASCASTAQLHTTRLTRSLPPTTHPAPTQPTHRHLTTTPTTPPANPPTAPSPAQYHLLHYRYVANMMTRRTPHRPSHLSHTQPYVRAGQLLLGGANPPEAKEALLVFRGLDRAGVEGFAKKDPYVLNGLVEEWRVQEWTVVVGSAM